jgi:hypothetical protein
MIDSLLNAEVHAGASGCAVRRYILEEDPDRAAREFETAQQSRRLFEAAQRRFNKYGR